MLKSIQAQDSPLQVALGQHTDKGRKSLNQDFIGAYFPEEPQRSTKGIVVAIADGISTSEVSHIASETAVSSFIHDYYSTSEAWSVKRSAECVIRATNAWLHAQSRKSTLRFQRDKGYLCTFSAMVLKGNIAHLLHCGDTRIYRLVDLRLEQLTDDHRQEVDSETNYLTKALGLHADYTPDYRAVTMAQGDIFILASDGVYEYIPQNVLVRHLVSGATKPGKSVSSENLDLLARQLIDIAKANGSHDNLSLQIVKVQSLPQDNLSDWQQVATLPFPPVLQPGMDFDGYRVIKTLTMNSRSHVFLAHDKSNNDQCVIKVPASDVRQSSTLLTRFLLEEWIARRVDNVHVMSAHNSSHSKRFLYTVLRYIEGETLGQWLRDHAQPSLAQVRNLTEQIATGLQALHRQEMVHQDLRPENILFDGNGVAHIIDFGATKVAGLTETEGVQPLLGSLQFTAPEYFLGEPGDARADIFSLGVMVYYMLTKRLPYGIHLARANSRAAQEKLRYIPVHYIREDVPAWVDSAINKAVALEPRRRYSNLSEFVYDLSHPNEEFVLAQSRPLIERNPLRFWQVTSGVLMLLVLVLTVLVFKG